MKASAFSDAQKAFILKQGADGVPVAEISAGGPESVRRRTSIGRRSTTASPYRRPKFGLTEPSSELCRCRRGPHH